MMLRRYHNVAEEILEEEQVVTVEVNSEEQDVPAETTDYNLLKVDELKQLLDEREIAYSTELKKADLIGLLEGEANATERVEDTH